MVIREVIFETVRSVAENSELEVKEATPLIGDGSVLDSMKLVELCLRLEDLASSYHFEFDWTSEAAMSTSRSMFRTAGSLADAFIDQMNVQR